jgi:hypothetical protein
MERVPVDREIVTRFVDHLRDEGRSGLKVDCWQRMRIPGSPRSKPLPLTSQ